jgi:acyl-CoA reductase-like NAD-dependent aldehyde dehydrogenase
MHNDGLDEVFDLIRSRRDEISLLITEERSLSNDKRQRILRYLRGFYNIIEDPRKLERRLKATCR